MRWVNPFPTIFASAIAKHSSPLVGEVVAARLLIESGVYCKRVRDFQSLESCQALGMSTSRESIRVWSVSSVLLLELLRSGCVRLAAVS